MMFCGTDWSGFAEEDVGYAVQVLQDWSLLPAFLIASSRACSISCTRPACSSTRRACAAIPFQAGGEPVFDNSNVYYDGNSQAVFRCALMGVIQDVTRACWGAGMSQLPVASQCRL